MDETSSISAVVSSEGKLNLPPCKFFISVLLSSSFEESHLNALVNCQLSMSLCLVSFIFCVSTEA